MSAYNKCTYCGWGFIYKVHTDYTCDKCEKMVKKLDSETLDWLMTIVDNKVEKAIDEHIQRYSHESSAHGYY